LQSALKTCITNNQNWKWTWWCGMWFDLLGK